MRQLVRPAEVMNELLDTLFTVQGFVVAGVLVVALATVGTVVLVFLLSLRLRRREIETMARIGGSERRVAFVLSSEAVVVLATTFALAVGLTLGTSYFAESTIRIFILA